MILTLICKLPSPYFGSKSFAYLETSSLQTVQIHVFWDRSHVFLKTVQFHHFGPSSFIPLERPVLALWNVHLHFLRPSSFIPLDRPLIFLKIVQFGPLGPSTLIPWDRPESFLQIVQSFSFGPSTFVGRPLWVFWTVKFDPWPSSFSRLDRPV